MIRRYNSNEIMLEILKSWPAKDGGVVSTGEVGIELAGRLDRAHLGRVAARKRAARRRGQIVKDPSKIGMNQIDDAILGAREIASSCLRSHFNKCNYGASTFRYWDRVEIGKYRLTPLGIEARKQLLERRNGR